MISVNKLFSSRRVVAESAFAVSRRGKRSARVPGSTANNFIHIETCNAAEFANRRLKSDRIGQQDVSDRVPRQDIISPDAANVGYRTAALRNAKIASNETGPKKFFLNLFRV
jgi:hypothetical protein